MALLTKKIKVRAYGTSLKHYKDLGYDCKNGDWIEIPVEQLKTGSEARVEVKCEGGCDANFTARYCDYLRAVKNGVFHDYCCKKCTMRVTVQKTRNPESIEKAKITRRKTCIENTGYEYSFLDPAVKEKTKETLLRERGVDNISKDPNIKQKKADDYFKKRGVRHPFQDPEVKQKIKNLFKEEYGVEYAGQIPFVIQKIIDTTIERYKVAHISLLPSVKEKTRKTKEERGVIMPLELKTELQAYRLIVVNGTNRNEREFWRSWNGIGQHSKDDIRENFRLHSNDRYYPTIDHRISVIDGFMNNIPPEEIYDLKNLCATERWLNSSKGRKNEDEFMKILEQLLIQDEKNNQKN